MCMWLCIKCLCINAWKKPCTSKIHPAEVFAGPLNVSGAYFLIHGVSKPQGTSGASTYGVMLGLESVEEAVNLTEEILDLLFRRKITTMVPKCSAEERSGIRKKLQIAAINQALVKWNEPQGCYHLIQKLLDISKPKPRATASVKKQKKDANIEAYRWKISNGHYSAAIRILSSY
ncbi:uncharacterized protein LOC113277759 [Papaver somniferum]|uniref:uncharacterized protein LOC113277759 n=1 Tax=Papaver somniferum TaxID=3469 RepID=UPI000E7052E5|nr:uncharacterized protein LOC113277759 [Papaver somniferum]